MKKTKTKNFPKALIWTHVFKKRLPCSCQWRVWWSCWRAHSQSSHTPTTPPLVGGCSAKHIPDLMRPTLGRAWSTQRFQLSRSTLAWEGPSPPHRLGRSDSFKSQRCESHSIRSLLAAELPEPKHSSLSTHHSCLLWNSICLKIHQVPLEMLLFMPILCHFSVMSTHVIPLINWKGKLADSRKVINCSSQQKERNVQWDH